MKKNEDQSENMDNQGAENEGEEIIQGDENKAFSELLEGIDARDDSSENEKQTEPEESEELDMDSIADFDLSDIISEEPETENTSESEVQSDEKTDSGKYEIDLDALEETESTDYSSVLDEFQESGTPEKSESDQDSEVETASDEDVIELPVGDTDDNSKEAESSYASIVEENFEESSTEESTGEFEILKEEALEGEEGIDSDMFEKLGDDESVVETDDSFTSIDEDLSLLVETEPEEETTTSDAAATEADEDSVVIGGFDEDETDEDFLGVEEETPAESDDGILAGFSDVKKNVPTEVLFEGIEMDAEEQIADITRAELLLAQGETEEAAKLFSRVSEKKGETPWVTKRLKELNLKSSNESENVDETEES